MGVDEEEGSEEGIECLVEGEDIEEREVEGLGGTELEDTPGAALLWFGKPPLATSLPSSAFFSSPSGLG